MAKIKNVLALHVSPLTSPEGLEQYAAEISTLTETIERDRDGVERQRAALLQDFTARQRRNIERRDQLLDAIRLYFEAHQEELLPRDRKSLKVSAGTIGTRLTRWILDTLDLDRALQAIKRRQLYHLVHIKITPKKEAIKEHLLGKLKIPGLSLRRRERFFFALDHPAVVFSHDERGYRCERKKTLAA